MKRSYQKPVAEKIEFCYRDQVVAASGSGVPTGKCYSDWEGEKSYDSEECVIQIIEAHTAS